MRRLLCFVVVGLALAIALVAACAPIFGIVSRYDGPTWCQEDAQAALNGYCDDFDYVLPSTAAQEFPAHLGGSAAITDAAANSPPNSFAVTSLQMQGTEAGLQTGNLVTFGGMPNAQGLPTFECQADLLTSDLTSMVATVGVLGVGGQLSPPKGQLIGPPEIVVMSVGPNSGVSFSLQKLAMPTLPPDIRDECPGSAQNAGTVFMGDWVTFKFFVTPESALDAGDAGVPSVCELKDPDAPDAGKTAREPYIVLIRAGDFDLKPIRLSDPGFIDLPYFVYGLLHAGEGSVPATHIHVDNARCVVKPAP
jgi:hypothetical protein